jgi:trk system potassium uptake protein TrkH
MLTGAINFSLHFLAFKYQNLRMYWDDAEFKFYALIIGLTATLVIWILWDHHFYDTFFMTVTQGIFHTINFCTTTGFGNYPDYAWPTVIPIVLMFVSIIGACTGSTGGGLKVMRVLLLQQQGLREINRVIHANAHYVVKLGNRTIPYRTLDAIWGFLGIFIAIFILLVCCLSATGLDFLSAFSAVSSALTGTGIALGSVTHGFQSITDNAKYILSFAMLAGRLELFVLLVLFMPTYWRD